ncbi:hypothetical protein ACJJTC_017798 [Scirpophaga incertulas]
MKYLVLCLIVAASHAGVLKDEESKNIPRANLQRLIAIDPPGFIVEWLPVESMDPGEPVIGYKVKVWEQQSKKSYSYQNVDGENKLVEKDILEKLPKNDIPSFAPIELDVKGADTTSIEYKNIKRGIEYEVRVQAYSSKGRGPLSGEMTIQLS